MLRYAPAEPHHALGRHHFTAHAAPGCSLPPTAAGIRLLPTSPAGPIHAAAQIAHHYVAMWQQSGRCDGTIPSFCRRQMMRAKSLGRNMLTRIGTPMIGL